jgi:hypothetical protein
MPAPRALSRTRLIGLIGISIVAGCQGGGPAPGRTVDPSASPILDTDAEFCTALDVLEGELANLRTIRLRPGNRRALDDQFEEVDIAVDDVMRHAPDGMAVQLRELDGARIELGLGVEDYTTTNRFEEAADHVYRKELQFDRAIGRVRARTTCPAYASTPPPERTPSPEPSPSGSMVPAAASGVPGSPASG